MKSKALITHLSDGEVHSGESLAAKLGVSRTAVWKQVRKAMEEGVEIQTIRGKGYQLLSSVDLLDADSILSAIAPEYRGDIALQVLDEVGSTNAEVGRRMSSGEASLPITIADCQTAGRGRRGRVWTSPRGENLYLSMGITLQGGFSRLDGLSLVLGVAVANALERLGAQGLGLKWPNDIFVPGGKLGGILVELQGELQEGVVQVIAGFGINVHAQTLGGVDQPWSSLARSYPDVRWRRNDLAGNLITAVQDALDLFSRDGFGAFLEPWQARDIFKGQSVEAKGGGVVGIAAGIDERGNYLVRTGDGTVPVRAGEISLRVVS
ncbi:MULTISPECIES: biotin--[acetyl-CoA-carboxylase] ligase [Marinobacter]|uniref:Bifunctional ligase/repressor BirA n=1 Tax=Marinobacter suaedae TaxID=3057675 RepID=A0ABT8W4F7_9GAMM|nr:MULTISPECIES: biotin--[acetyl-CoA-carboxylase] ligase [unclassified Marinobacter]MBZ2170254.1 biotin--[acetyl-CoA-carboxylase] ligase [Marinobacter sp. F4216]MDO3723129.1 biotin--[acetyl-CoA-carboxylase] ligase [Marinobacter sp. chi1]